MANHKSALKRARQNEKKRLINKIRKTHVKNAFKEVRLLIEEDPLKSVESLKKAMSAIDKAASKKVLHRRTASRRIARLSKQLYKAQNVEA